MSRVGHQIRVSSSALSDLPTVGMGKSLLNRSLGVVVAPFWGFAFLTTKVTTISGDGWPNLGVCAQEEPNCASRWMPIKHEAQGAPHLWQARESGVRIP